MEEIKVGEYVRAKQGCIDKIYEYKEDVKIYICERELIIDTENMIGLHIQDVAKHSKNIIDLIEVGDYVNGSRVVDVLEDMKTGELHLEMTYNYTNEEKGDCTIYNKDIKSIVTKEQFKSVEYNIGE